MSYVFRNNMIERWILGIDYVDCIIQWRGKMGWLIRRAWMCVVNDRRWLVSSNIDRILLGVDCWCLSCASNVFWKRIKSLQVVYHVGNAAAWTPQKCLCFGVTHCMLTMPLYWPVKTPPAFGSLAQCWRCCCWIGYSQFLCFWRWWRWCIDFIKFLCFWLTRSMLMLLLKWLFKRPLQFGSPTRRWRCC